MKKRFWVLILTVFVFMCVPFLMNKSAENSSYTAVSSETGNFMSYNKAINSSKPSVILFYANWCTYCRKFMPKFNSLAKMYAEKYNFVKINIESSDNNKALSKQYGIRSLPTVYIVEKKYRVKKQVSPYAYDSVENMKSELDRYLKKRR